MTDADLRDAALPAPLFGEKALVDCVHLVEPDDAEAVASKIERLTDHMKTLSLAQVTPDQLQTVRDDMG
jgi:hypothetical protein